MKYYIITGETSGDLHASNLVKHLLKLDNNAIIRAWGGNELKKLPITVVKELHELNFMGLVEVIKHLHIIRKNFNFAHQDIINFKPDVLILVDFPGFNLRIAKWAKAMNFRVFYYISPTVWAWHKSRIKSIRNYIDKMFVILPFEKDFYKQHGVEVEYEGHPILDALDSELNKKPNLELFCNKHNLKVKPIIAILPGSRKQEIKRLLPTMLSITTDFPTFNFIVAGLSSVPKEMYDIVNQYENARVIIDSTYEILNHSYAAIVKSGTSTLETALFKVPQVVCYSVNSLTYFIARQLVSVKYISLVNLLLNKESVKELIQKDFNKKNLQLELQKILEKDKRNQLEEDYDKLAKLLKGKGCSERVAKKIIENIQTK